MNRRLFSLAAAALLLAGTIAAAVAYSFVPIQRLLEPPIVLAVAVGLSFASPLVWRTRHELRGLISTAIEHVSAGFGRLVAPLTGTPELTSFG